MRSTREAAQLRFSSAFEAIGHEPLAVPSPPQEPYLILIPFLFLVCARVPPGRRQQREHGEDALFASVARATLIETTRWIMPKSALIAPGALPLEEVSARWFLVTSGRVGT